MLEERPSNSHTHTYNNGSNGNGNSNGHSGRKIDMHPDIAQAYNSDTRNKIYSTILRIVKNRADADELLNDTFKCANRGYANFRGDSQIDTWLYRIATNLSRNRLAYWRRRRVKDTFSLDSAIDAENENSDSIADLISYRRDPSTTRIQREVELGEIEERIVRGMEYLSAKHREILILNNIKDMSYEEIASTLGINVGTVKSRIARARNDLYKRVYGHDAIRPPSKTSK